MNSWKHVKHGRCAFGQQSVSLSLTVWRHRQLVVQSCSVHTARVKSGTPCLRAKEEGELSSVSSVFSSKAQHLWWYGVHMCICYGQLACFGRHYVCWRVYKGFRVIYAPLQMMSISGKALCISAGQCKTTYYS